MANYFHSRVNPKKTQPNSDYAVFMADMVTKREAIWDKDHYGKIKTGDYIGFITGPTGSEVVYIYKVKEELPASERPAHWKSSDPHTEGNGKTCVGERGVVVLTNIHDIPRKQYEWSEIRDATRRSTNGSTKGIPRGTERVVTHKNLLPFFDYL
jgi:hypothetical protein